MNKIDNTINAKASVFYKCSKCGTENSPNITNKILEENETIIVECSTCKNKDEINSKKLIEVIKKQAFEEVKKEFKKIFK